MKDSMAQPIHQALRRFWLLVVPIAGLLLFLAAPLPAADTMPLPHFAADERWAADSSVKDAPPPVYTVTAGADGVTVAFAAGDAASQAIITSTRWKVSDPIGIAPTCLALDIATAAADLQVSPILVDAEGTDFALTPRPATGGTLQWDLPADSKKCGQQPGAVITGDGKTSVGPVYLKEIQISKPAGGAAAIKFTACQVTDNPNPPKPLALASDPLWKFDRVEGWVDVNNNEEGRAQFEMTYDPDGTTITFQPLKRGLTLKLATLTQLHEGQFGHARRIITQIDYDGPANTAFVGLGMKDAEHEVVSTPSPPAQPPVPNAPLTAGSNQIIWDAANIASPWRGGHNGYVDFPVSLDDFTLNVRASDQPIKVVFRGATIESWQPLLRAMSVDAGRPRFLWTLGEKASLSVNLKNIGTTPVARDMQFALKDDLAHELWNRNVHVTVPAGASAPATIAFETKGMPQGVYLLEWASSLSTDGIKGMTMVTVADDKPLPKGAAGEFAFGMDIGARWTQDPILDWADWCGVDIIRSAGREPNFLGGHFAEFQDAFAACAQHGIRSQMLLWPMTPWDPDPVKFDVKIKEAAAFATQLATRLKSTDMHWYEIGNEPSLTFFFHGPPADFVKFFVAVRDAIKAADPQATVTVGGLAFAGMANAEPRANQIVQLMPFDKIDGFGYHGHGEGAKAERWAYETNMRRMAKAAGKDTKPYYETESGATSTDPASWREQARTVVEKFAYAQSLHTVPVFMWFGFHPNWVWGILQTLHEAKPAALAFRVYVQNARHLVGQDRLDLTGAQGEAYWLKPKDPGDTRCTIVLWSDVGEFTRMINLGPAATDVRLMDMFGNAQPLNINADGLVQVNVDENPVYVLANRPADAAAPMILPPTLDVPKEIRVVPGTSDALMVSVSNPSSQAISGQVTIKPAGAAPVGEAQAPVAVAAKGRTAVTVPLQIAAQPIDYWPRAWTVFAPVKGDVDLTQFNTIPTALPADPTAQPQVGAVVGNVLNLEPLGQGHAERKQAICFSKITVEQDTEAEVGIAADYWLEFYVNGKKVLDTLAAGNGGDYVILTHVITIHLNKGDNFLAVRVLSGSGGWKLVSGGPQAVAAARRARAGTVDAAIVELHNGQAMTARESVRLVMLPPLALASKDTPWDKQPTDATIEHVGNYFLKQPDQSKWYHGPADLSGKVWLRATSDGGMIIAVAVRDDLDMPKDAIAIRLASGSGWKNRLELRSDRNDGIKRRRDEPTTTTWYEATIPPAVFSVQPREKIAINVVIDDDDWGEIKQRGYLVFSDDPSSWYQTWRR